jgi:hypothetical protein
MAESDPMIWVIVSDAEGNTVRRVRGPIEQGMNRVAWDLRYSAPYAVELNSEPPELGDEPSGMLAAPGEYSATLAKEVGGEITALSGPVHFEVVPLREGALQGSSPAEAAAFWRSYEETVRNSSAVSQSLDTELARVEAMRTALSRASAAPGELDERLAQLRNTLQKLQDDLTGNRAKRQVGDRQSPNVESRLNAVELGIYGSTYGPTATHRMTLGLANDELQQITSRLAIARSDAATLGDDLLRAGAPWVEGNPLPE